jgi:hypothetical protein
MLNTIKSGCSLLILIIFSQFIYAEATAKNPYALPQSKLNIDFCQSEALALHSGVIEKERLFHQQNRSQIRYDIQSSDNSEWSVLCDLETGKILAEQRRIGDRF